jgi:hypothetical protein
MLEHAEELSHSADEQALLVDLHPRARGGREDHVIAGFDGHLHADVIPPVKPRSDRQDDPLLGRWLIGSWGDQQPGASDSIGIELLDDDAIEEWSQLVAHGLKVRAVVAD